MAGPLQCRVRVTAGELVGRKKQDDRQQVEKKLHGRRLYRGRVLVRPEGGRVDCACGPPGPPGLPTAWRAGFRQGSLRRRPGACTASTRDRKSTLLNSS